MKKPKTIEEANLMLILNLQQQIDLLHDKILTLEKIIKVLTNYDITKNRQL